MRSQAEPSCLTSHCQEQQKAAGSRESSRESSAERSSDGEGRARSRQSSEEEHARPLSRESREGRSNERKAMQREEALRHATQLGLGNVYSSDSPTASLFHAIHHVRSFEEAGSVSDAATLKRHLLGKHSNSAPETTDPKMHAWRNSQSLVSVDTQAHQRSYRKLREVCLRIKHS